MKKIVQVSRSPDPRINKVVAAIKEARRNIGRRREILGPVMPLLAGIDNMSRAEALDLARKLKDENGKDITSRDPKKSRAALAWDSYLQRFIMSRAPIVEQIF